MGTKNLSSSSFASSFTPLTIFYLHVLYDRNSIQYLNFLMIRVDLCTCGGMKKFDL